MLCRPQGANALSKVPTKWVHVKVQDLTQLPGRNAARESLGLSCAEQLGQRNLHRTTCTEQQVAQRNLHKATCPEQLVQSDWNEATCKKDLNRVFALGVYRACASCSVQVVGMRLIDGRVSECTFEQAASAWGVSRGGGGVLGHGSGQVDRSRTPPRRFDTYIYIYI